MQCNAMKFALEGNQYRYKESRSQSHTNSMTMPQTPQIRIKYDKSTTFLPCPPVKACTLTEPLAASVGSAKRPVPISKVLPPASRLTTCPEIVTPTAVAFNVIPSTTTKEDRALTSYPWIVTPDGTWDAKSGIVLEPTTNVPEG